MPRKHVRGLNAKVDLSTPLAVKGPEFINKLLDLPWCWRRSRGRPRTSREFTNVASERFCSPLKPMIRLAVMSAAGLPLITATLLERGYSQSEVEKFLGGNLLRVFETVLGVTVNERLPPLVSCGT